MKHWILFLLIMLSPALAWAEAPPVPKSKTEVVGSIEKRLHNEKKQKKELAKQVKNLEGQIDKTREKLVDVARSVQNNEKDLQNLERRIKLLEKEQREIQGTLDKDRGQIARLILALERIKRVPPEALLARPEAPYKTAQSAMLMGDIIPSIHKHAEALKVKLTELEDVSVRLTQDRQSALKTASTLKAEHTKLSQLVDKREELYKQTNRDYKKREKEVLKISKQARNLQDLVEKLEKDRRRQADKRTAQKAAARAAKTPVPKPGQPQLPVSGIIRTSYDDPDDFGAPSKGVTIEGREGAIVVAPMGGVVRFTGPFKRYGQLIILEHADGYHSLIAGLEKIDTVVGHNVSVGEPLGLLQREGSGVRPELYYELRLNGKPINPSRKFADLS